MSSGPLRVVQFLPSVESASGGPVRSTLANCQAAHRADPEMETVWISTRYGLDPAWERELRSSLPPRMSLELFPQFGTHTANLSPALLRWMWHNLASHHLLVLRALMHPLTSAAGWVARRKGVPYLVVPHGTLSEWTFRHRRRLLKRLYFRFVERKTLEGAAAVRYTCETERREARRLDFTAEGRVIPHPFDSRPQDQRENERDCDQLLFLSRLDPKKGIEVLLDAVVLARRQRPSLRLVLAGSGAKGFEREIRDMISERELAEVVEVPGFVTGKEKERLLCQSGAFVLPSREENFGIAVVEALDAGLPVVISRGVGIWREVEEAEAGLVVDRDPREIASAVITLLEDSDLRSRMGAHGRRFVRSGFDPDRVGRELSSLYRTAAGCEAC